MIEKPTPSAQKRKTLKVREKIVINAWSTKRNTRAVPAFAETIVNEIKKADNKQKLKSLILSKIEDYGAITYDSANDVARMDLLLEKYSVENLEAFNREIEGKYEVLREHLYRLAIAEILIVVTFLIMGSL